MYCTYIRNNHITDAFEDWSDEYLIKWHACLRLTCRNVFPEFIDCVEECSLPKLKVILMVLIILAWFM